MIKEAGIDFNVIEPEASDNPFGEYTGAGTIFGASGGVAEAAVRTAYEFATNESLENADIKEFRGTSNRCRDIELDLKGTKKETFLASFFSLSCTITLNFSKAIIACSLTATFLILLAILNDLQTSIRKMPHNTPITNEKAKFFDSQITPSTIRGSINR